VTGSLFDPSPAFDRTRLAESLKRLAKESIYIGTSSWKYEGWLGQIYSHVNYVRRGKFSKQLFEQECLAEYAQVFPTVCGDFAFYQFPSDAFWKRLFDLAPPEFRFAFKIPEQITCKVFPAHPRYGAQGGLANPTFLDAALLQEAFLRPLEPYRERICVLIFEFGAFSRKSFEDVREFVAALDPFLAALPKGFRYSVEIRNPEFLDAEYFDCLRGHGVAHVYNGWAKMPEIGTQMSVAGSVTADFVVARALLRRGRVYEDAVGLFQPYTEIQDPNPETRAALKEMVARSRMARREAYIYVNNRLEGNAPLTIEAVVEGS
jgi:uncharacterized protein YecE (DUF72 family)